jgi:hypothetical protein
LPTVEKLTVKLSDRIHATMSTGQLLIISPDGSISVGDYRPPRRE